MSKIYCCFSYLLSSITLLAHLHLNAQHLPCQTLIVWYLIMDASQPNSFPYEYVFIVYEFCNDSCYTHSIIRFVVLSFRTNEGC